MVIDLQAVDLLDIEYSARLPMMRLIVKRYGEDSTYSVENSSVLLFSISNTPGDMESPFIVDITTSTLPGGALDRLRSAGYSWREIESPEALYHLHVDGGVVIDVYSDSPFHLAPYEVDID